MERIAQTVNPIKRGYTLFPETNLPINVLMGTAIKVEISPVMAAAIPAICPTGSMANARRLPNRNPTAKNCKAKKMSKM